MLYTVEYILHHFLYSVEFNNNSLLTSRVTIAILYSSEYISNSGETMAEETSLQWVSFRADAETISKLERMVLEDAQARDLEEVNRSSFVRRLIRQEWNRRNVVVSAETVARDPAVMLTAEERAKIGV